MRPVGVLLAVLACCLGLAGTAGAAPGDLDPSFSGDGLLRVDLGGMPDVEWASAVAVQDDGRIVVAGTAPRGPGYYDFVVLRRNPDGSPDTTFSGDGRATLDIDQYDQPAAVAIAPGGEIVVAGFTYQSILAPAIDSVLVRLRPDGSPDTGFSGDGWLRADVPGNGGRDSFEDVAIQDDGRIVAAGQGGFTTGGDMTVLRYEEDGDPDATFSGDGLQTVDSGDYDRANAVAIQPDGRIVVAGDATPMASSQSDFALARLEQDGDPDPAFSADGKVRTNVGGQDSSYDVAVQPDGRIVAAGVATPIGRVDSDVAITRYLADGRLDASLAGDGTVLADLRGAADIAWAMAVQPDGRLVVGGLSVEAQRSAYDFALARFTAAGALDPSFSCDGKAFTDFGFDGEDGRDLTLDGDGKIVIVGQSGTGGATAQGHYDAAIARYLTAGARGPCTQGGGPPAGGGTPGGGGPVVVPPPVGPGADRSAPEALVRVVAIVKLRTLLRRGWPVRVVSSEPGFVTARLQIRARDAKRLGLVKRGRRAVVVASGSARLDGREARLRLRPTRAAQRRLKRARRLMATLRSTVTDLAGNRRTLSRRMILRR